MADRPAQAPLRVTMLVAIAFVMDQIDATIVANAAPSIARTFDVPPARIAVAVAAYLVTVAALIPVSGWCADRFGVRWVFVVAVIVFVGASAGCALSESLTELVVLRVMQAAGAAMLVPVGRMVVLRATAKEHLIRAVALLTWPALIAPLLAPALSGLLTTYLSWRWIFLVNVPVGVVVAVWGLSVLPRGRAPRTSSLDIRGVVLLVVSLGLLTCVSSWLAEQEVPTTMVIVGAVVTAVAGWSASRHLLRNRHPLLDLRILSVPTFRLSHASGSIFRMTVLGLPFLLPLAFQTAFGWTPLRAGFIVLFLFVGNVAIKPVTTPLLRRVGFRTTLLAATTLMTISIAACAALGPHSPLALVAGVLAVGGVARSVGFSVYNTIAFADVPAARMSAASTLASSIQQLALGCGIAAAAIALRLGDAASPHDLVSAFRIAFLMLAGLTLVTIAAAWRLPADAGLAVRAAARPKTNRHAYRAS